MAAVRRETRFLRHPVVDERVGANAFGDDAATTATPGFEHDQRFTHESVIGAVRQLYRPPHRGRALRRGRAQDQRQAYITEISQIGLDPINRGDVPTW
jgi:hypothetical protein